MLTFDINVKTGKLLVRSQDSTLFDQIREHFSVKNEGARFARRFNRYIPQRKYIISNTGICELGLYWEIRQYLVKNQINVQINITAALQKMLDVGISADLHTDFKFNLRSYQEEVLRRALKLGRGSCILGTGAGKTFTTAALIENYYRNSKDKDTFKCLMIVPDLTLVEQTYNEFNSVGITYTTCRWTGKHKPNLESNVIICNIGILQSQYEDNDWVKHIDLLIVDECHKLLSSNKISKIVNLIRTPNKYGFTGTLPEASLDKWSIIGKLGPVIYEKTSYELRVEDYLANVTIRILNLEYSFVPRYETDNEYRGELDFIYENESRNKFLTKLCSKLENNTLILVNHIKHGEQLMLSLQNIPDKLVYFIRGDVEVEERERIKQIMEDNSNVICVAISAIFSTGVNIKNLHNIIFAAGGKSFIRTVQSIGRGLRKHDTKDKLVIFDICDQLRYGINHRDKRKRIYEKEKIKYTENNFKMD